MTIFEKNLVETEVQPDLFSRDNRHALDLSYLRFEQLDRIKKSYDMNELEFYFEDHSYIVIFRDGRILFMDPYGRIVGNYSEAYRDGTYKADTDIILPQWLSGIFDDLSRVEMLEDYIARKEE